MMELKQYFPGYIEIRHKIRITDSRQTPTLQNERMPNAQGMAEICSRAGFRVCNDLTDDKIRPEI